MGMFNILISIVIGLILTCLFILSFVIPYITVPILLAFGVVLVITYFWVSDSEPSHREP